MVTQRLPGRPRRSVGWVAGLLAFLLATALVSCIRGRTLRDVQGPPLMPPGPRIDHMKHLDKGLECADCHQVKPPEKEEAKKEDKDGDGADEAKKDEKKEEPYIEPGPPSYAQCSDCHDDEDEKKPAEKKIKNLFFTDDGKKPKWGKAAWDYAPEIEWKHEYHRSLECKTCHGDMKSQERRSGLLFTMDACIACHTERNGPRNCQACHSTISTETVPESHRHLWQYRHGKVARTQLERAEGRCQYCHTDPFFCERCHREEKPKSHNNLWRHRTHGIAASMDRTSCQVCHQSDFCIRCHSETMPASHRGMWAHGFNTHCAVCHFPISSNPDCVVCHTTNPTHSTAPDQPAWHVPGMNCRLCHNAVGGGGAQPLTHFDNGMQCEFCHH